MKVHFGVSINELNVIKYSYFFVMLQTFINLVENTIKMSSDLSEFQCELVKCDDFFHQLRKRIFLKTQLDVVYTDFTNWERYDLLFIDHDVKKVK